MLKELRQIKMITVKDVEATAKSLGMEPGTGRSGLLDSGASHACRQGSEEEITAADRVKVQLANGECVTLAQNRAGTLLATKTTPEDDALPIVPLGSLVQDLNCELTWGRKRGLEIRHPIHGIIRPRVIGKCPLIGETQALQLIKELEDKRGGATAVDDGDAAGFVDVGSGCRVVQALAHVSEAWWPSESAFGP